MERGTITTDRFEMDYCRFGNGKKNLVILPGMSIKPVTPMAEAIAQAYDLFTKDYTVYLFDRKKDMEYGYSAEDMAEDTYQAMQKLGIDRASIFGVSQGGMMALALAVDHPEFVEKLVPGSTLARKNEAEERCMTEWIMLAKKKDAAALNRSFRKTVYSDEYLNMFEAAFRAVENDVNDDEFRRTEILAQACLDFDIYDRLDRITCPVFVLGSWKDKALTGKASVELAERLQCRLFMYEGYSHAVYDEAPDYKEKVLEFLNQ